MAADIYIRVLPPDLIDHLRRVNLLDKWAEDLTEEEKAEPPFPGMVYDDFWGWEWAGAPDFEVRYRHLYAPAVHVGPISYMKASMDADDERWLPGPTQGAVEAIGEEPVRVTPKLITRVMVAMNVPDRSHYRKWPDKPNRRRVKRFLQSHLGELVYVDWE